MCSDSSMPLAEHVTASCRRCPTTVKSSVWVSTPISREVAVLTASPGALGGDAHRFCGRSRPIRRTQRPSPNQKPVGTWRRRWRCRKNVGSALVGGHHQVGIVAVAPHHLRWEPLTSPVV